MSETDTITAECEYCAAPFEYVPRRGGRGRKFCSDLCAGRMSRLRKAEKANPDKALKEAL